MNKVILLGRLTRDPEIKYAQANNMAVARFSVAVTRRFKNSDGNYDADFPSCTAFGKTAEFIEKYFHQGDPISLDGRLQTGSFTKQDGTKVYTTDVIVDNVEFVPNRANGGNNAQATDTTAAMPDFMNIPDDVGDMSELPFN